MLTKTNEEYQLKITLMYKFIGYSNIHFSSSFLMYVS